MVGDAHEVVRRALANLLTGGGELDLLALGEVVGVIEVEPRAKALGVERTELQSPVLDREPTLGVVQIPVSPREVRGLLRGEMLLLEMKAPMPPGIEVTDSGGKATFSAAFLK